MKMLTQAATALVALCSSPALASDRISDRVSGHPTTIQQELIAFRSIITKGVQYDCPQALGAQDLLNATHPSAPTVSFPYRTQDI
ncbi:hypothetical protein HOH67_00985 [Candidatus Peregrinibacteria bacterium]|jgi:hypothetical protein|nr:hypothetical protein [Candidatus Peregrinibacteria bacterium]MBT5516458.1 hypothetical protein [Candidatus Peregrinibacteria bacterium]MBT5823683.1 hypothetical protein [Candidatus Peregrinibacteria bacterium]